MGKVFRPKNLQLKVDAANGPLLGDHDAKVVGQIDINLSNFINQGP